MFQTAVRAAANTLNLEGYSDDEEGTDEDDGYLYKDFKVNETSLLIWLTRVLKFCHSLLPKKCSLQFLLFSKLNTNLFYFQ